MRSANLTFAVAACLLACAGAVAAGSPPLPAAPAAAAPSAAPGTDAAARHAKRVGCLRAARKKKLFGADKKAYIAHCVANP